MYCVRDINNILTWHDILGITFQSRREIILSSSRSWSKMNRTEYTHHHPTHVFLSIKLKSKLKKYFWKIHKIWRKYLQNSQLTLTVTESLSLAPVSVVPEQTYVPWWFLVTAEKMSWSPCTLSWPSGRGPPSLAQERFGAGSPLPWNRIKEVVCDFFMNVCSYLTH